MRLPGVAAWMPRGRSRVSSGVKEKRGFLFECSAPIGPHDGIAGISRGNCRLLSHDRNRKGGTGFVIVPCLVTLVILNRTPITHDSREFGQIEAFAEVGIWILKFATRPSNYV
jgi:hypothetical protein